MVLSTVAGVAHLGARRIGEVRARRAMSRRVRAMCDDLRMGWRIADLFD